MRMLKALLAAASLIFASFAGAQDLKEGRDYTVIATPQPTEAPGKIEVVELFWYGCSHCFDFDPLLNKWLKNLPKDVAFRRVPAIFPNGSWAPGARIYYALEATGQLEKLHGEIFDAIHVDRYNLNDPKVLTAWLTKKGVDAQKFMDAYNSFAVQGKVQRSLQLTKGYGINGVPALIVQGKYMPASGAAGSYEDVLVVVDKLIAKARAEQGKK